MLDVNRVMKNTRQLRALIGVSKEEFDALAATIDNLLHEHLSSKPRKRAVGGGRKGTLPGSTNKLFFILFYIKVYPTFDLAGFIFGADKSRCCEWHKNLLPLLEKVLGRSIEFPKRRLSSLKEFLEAFPDMKDIFVDGTERRVQRSKIHHKQAKKYSGKKKTHTRKNIIACDERGKILLVSPTKGGKLHDLKCFKKWGIGQHIPEDVVLWADKGFIGVKPFCKSTNIMVPHKRRPRVALTPEQKEENKVVSGLRIVVEHAIGGIKRFGCMSSIYRNRKGQDDRMIAVCSGLWNLHLQMKAAH